LSQKKARIDHRIQITTLAQPAKKNKKKLAKLVKLAKEASKL
jgi:myo-inositol catabolism protein IolC